MKKQGNNSPVISVIIPIYNVGVIIYRIIDCLKQQTYQDFEVIIVDDGSTDDSLAFCEKIARNNSKYYVFSKENQGAFSARNLGIEKARGKYIAFLDADDRIDINYLEELLRTCQNSDVAICDIAVIKDKRETFRFSCNDKMLNQMQSLNKLLIRKEINSGPCGKLFRRELIEDIRFPSLRVYEDILFVLDIFYISEKIAVTNKTTYYYIQEEKGTMDKFRSNPSLDIVIATRRLLEFIEQHKELEAECCYTTISHLYQYAFPFTVQNQFVESEFIYETRKIYRKYKGLILKCSAVPWREKVIIFLYAYGWIYDHGRIRKIQKEGKKSE